MSWDKIPSDLSHIRVISEENVSQKERVISYREAIREALYSALKEDSRVFLLMRLN